MKKLKYLVIHCTATPQGMNVSSDLIRKWHLQERGWSRVGYSDMIHLNGWIENLQTFDQDDTVDTWEITNGAKGINDISRHIVYVGGTDAHGKSMDTRTQRQFESLENYVKVEVRRHPGLLIAGHRDFANKDCPSFDVAKFCRMIGIPEENIYKKQ